MAIKFQRLEKKYMNEIVKKRIEIRNEKRAKRKEREHKIFTKGAIIEMLGLINLDEEVLIALLIKFYTLNEFEIEQLKKVGKEYLSLRKKEMEE